MVVVVVFTPPPGFCSACRSDAASAAATEAAEDAAEAFAAASAAAAAVPERAFFRACRSSASACGDHG